MIKSLRYKSKGFRKELKEICDTKERITIYFGFYDNDPESADHIGSVLFRRNTYYLHVEGWGIGSDTIPCSTLDELVKEIIKVNKFFNLTDLIHIEKKG